MTDVEKFVDQKWGHYTTGNLTQRTLMGAAQGYREGLIEAIKAIKKAENHLFAHHPEEDTEDYCSTCVAREVLLSFLKGLSDD